MKQTIAIAAAAVASILVATTVSAAPILEVEPNNSIGGAQNIDAAFGLGFDVNIENSSGVNTSTTTPHAEVQGTGDGTVDYFSFTGASGALMILDIDCGVATFGGCVSNGFIDAWIQVIAPNGNNFFTNDDSFLAVDTGSAPNGTLDSYIQATLSMSGLWIVAVGEFLGLQPVRQGGDYVLNVSVQGHSVPEPTTLLLLGLGLSGLGFARPHLQ